MMACHTGEADSDDDDDDDDASSTSENSASDDDDDDDESEVESERCLHVLTATEQTLPDVCSYLQRKSKGMDWTAMPPSALVNIALFLDHPSKVEAMLVCKVLLLLLLLLLLLPQS